MIGKSIYIWMIWGGRILGHLHLLMRKPYETMKLASYCKFEVSN